MMDNVNKGVACDVTNCKYNSEGVNCTRLRQRTVHLLRKFCRKILKINNCKLCGTSPRTKSCAGL